VVELNQYYTIDRISKVLTDLIPEINSVMRCLELSAGEGALLHSVSERWPAVKFTTIDLDPKNHQKLLTEFPSHEHYCCDALSDRVTLALRNKEFDLCVCNPPFGLMKSNPSINRILGAEYNNFVSKGGNVRSEIPFIIQNINYLRDGGVLAIILPELIVKSQRYHDFWLKLRNENSILSVVECDHRSFKKTEAKTFIIYVMKGVPNSDSAIKYYELSCSQDRHVISHKDVKEIFPDDPHEMFNGHVDGVVVFRGQISGKICKSLDVEYFHTTTHIDDFDSLSVGINKSKYKTAVSGDILMHRVGRSVGKVCHLISGELPISDCIIALRFEEKNKKELFLSFWRDNKDGWLQKNVKGTCAKHLTIDSVNKMLSEICSDLR
jgi:hypothetical protein